METGRRGLTGQGCEDGVESEGEDEVDVGVVEHF